ncbi:hypothetical protein BDB01DRAFT_786594 [Pilobolus umbonatus]|nr:hypothetical protein BDB01DRAFT_786594 [Pilobolus umbonatus]
MNFLWSPFGGKKETSPPPPVQNVAPQQAFKAMSSAFRKGVQYNMKIVLRGDVMTGKSNLFQRLQGAEFTEDYSSTPQIEVANIPWHHKDSTEIVKIEVWDVVDKAINKESRKVSDSIKLEHNTPAIEVPRVQEDSEMGLDASTVNVYRNTQAAIFMFDITKPWTFKYVNDELSKVPETIAVLVLGNFADKAEERKVSWDEIHAALYEHNQERIENGAIKPNLIRYAETSMKSGMGLKYIYSYLGVPFLQLMVETLKKQLELKAVEIVDLLEDLDVEEEVPETMQRRRGQDNFNQPSEPHLARQQEEMKSAWDQELEEIAMDHPSILEVAQFQREETPPPPTSPAKPREKNVVLAMDEIPPVGDQFDMGQLEDDWFGDDSNKPLGLSIANTGTDSDDDVPVNPMVAGDEDIEQFDYYVNPNKNSTPAVEKTKEEAMPVKKAENEMKHEPERHKMYHSSVYRNDMVEDVWSSGLRRTSQAEIISDSEDEDNRIVSIDTSHHPIYIESPPFHYGGDGYEEIGGANENPWSIGQINQNSPRDEPDSLQDEIHAEHSDPHGNTLHNDTLYSNHPKEQESDKEDDTTVQKPTTKKKRSSKKKSSKKKKSST